MDNYQYERELYQKGINYIGGIDEVGRGPLIGPVVAACVVLPKDLYIEGLTDSKRLSEKKRNYYYEVICEKAIAIGIGVVDENKQHSDQRGENGLGQEQGAGPLQVVDGPPAFLDH